MRRCLVILYLWLIGCVNVCSGRRWTFADTEDSEKKDSSDDYEADEPQPIMFRSGTKQIRSTRTQDGEHSRDITATVFAFNETFILDLTLNSRLFAAHYIEKIVTADGEKYNDVDHSKNHCFYIGTVRDRVHSTAAISTCAGATGYFSIGDVAYHIEPQEKHLLGHHVVSRSLPNAKSTHRCGFDEFIPDFPMQSATSNTGAENSFQWPQDGDKMDKVVELYVANDYSQFKARASNAEAVYQRTKDIVNSASLHYHQLGIYLVLVGVEVWTDGDKFPILNSNMQGALFSWYNYRQMSVNPTHSNDNGILITNVQFLTGSVGLALPATMCSYRNSGSIISDLSSRAGDSGVTMAHEMGHSFGVKHDNDVAQCNCDDANFCIMHRTINYNRPATKWSSCSRDQLNRFLSLGYDICLHNIPEIIFQPSSTCGNGIIEAGEQCDCGKAQINECNSKCCNNITCQLVASAACASGRCCDTSKCQIKSSGTECRSKSNDCDLPESCNGVNARCPTDSYKPDGTDCKNLDTAYCYRGQCRSHRSQCEVLWGPGTLVSTSGCYKQLNKRGSIDGNCGILWTNGSDYTECAEKDVMCGLLHCQDLSKKMYHYQNYYTLGSTSVDSSTCHSVIFHFANDVENPGLAPNGAKCGDRQMCVNQKCVNVKV